MRTLRGPAVLRRAAVVALCLVASAPAFAQEESLADKAGRWLDAFSRGLAYIGEKSEDLFAPRVVPFDDIDDFAGLYTADRSYQESFPVAADATISVANEFGAIRVEAWENPVVQVRARITVGAESLELASQLLRTTEVAVLSGRDVLNIRAEKPDTRSLGDVAMKIDYEILVPAQCGVQCENLFGAVSVTGVSGDVGVSNRFGAVTLAAIDGPVRVNARGENRLEATGLRQGGSFDLRWVDATFHGVGGTVSISNYHGRVELVDPGPAADIDIRSESGPIHVSLPAHSKPDLVATSYFGSVESSMPLERSTRGNLLLGRAANADSPQRISLYASFDTVSVVHGDASPASEDATPVVANDWVESLIEEQLRIPEGAALEIAAAPGHVRLEGADIEADRVMVRLTKRARMTMPRQAGSVLDLLGYQVDQGATRVVLTTDLPALLPDGVAEAAIDLVIECPRELNVIIRATDGRTSISGMGESVQVDQDRGLVMAEHCKGPMSIVLRAGDVTVQDGGELRVTAARGQITTRLVRARQHITGEQGRSLIESPMGPVELRQNGGDVTLMALDGIHGEIDVLVKRGDLSFALPPNPNANLTLAVHEGQVENFAVPLQGQVTPDRQNFQTLLGDGLHRIMLETHEGSIRLDQPPAPFGAPAADVPAGLPVAEAAQ